MTSRCGFTHFSPHIFARRFGGATARKSPTFAEISEACGILGVDVDCDQQQLKKVYRELVKKNHPDAGGDEALMSRITVAYDRMRGMSKLEKEQFKKQRSTYRAGSYYGSSNRNSGGNTDNNRAGYYHTGAGYSTYSTNSSSSRAQGFYGTANDDYFAQGPGDGRRGYYAYQQRGQRYGENPFSSAHPFAFYTQVRRAWTMPLSSIILRAIVFYLGLSVVFLMVYRHYRDWIHDDGWKMSESLARHEQLSELHRVRQEMNERIRAAREAAAFHDSNKNNRVRVFLSDGENDRGVTDYNAVALSQRRELQALEYARRRQMEMAEEMRGWPQFGEEKGRLIRRAQDPPGVVFFEPRRVDLLSRQVENLRLGREWSDRQQSATKPGKNDSVAGESLVADVASSSVPAATGKFDVVSSMASIFANVLDADPKIRPGD